MEIKVAVIGATGYSGYELIRLLVKHPFVRITHIMASEVSHDKPIDELYPQLKNVFHGTCQAYDAGKLNGAEIDAVFCATPDRISVEILPEIVQKGIRAIDLSGAFRLKNPALYSKWYGFEHGSPELLAESVYGLSEVNRPAIRGAHLVANPGCYPTSIVLPLFPLFKAGLIDQACDIICDAKSGVTGAGKVLQPAYLFAEVNENLKAYNVLAHRHSPEIYQALNLDYQPELVFVPHLLPINRGILTTMYVRLNRDASHDHLREVYRRSYSESPFIRLYENGTLPEIKYVTESNYCDIGWVVGENKRRMVIVSAIDNLVKGAAGQAIQNLNLMFGLEESVGIGAPSRTTEFEVRSP